MGREENEIHVDDGALAQLARALAWHARSHRFKSDMLHQFILGYVSLGYVSD